MKRITFLTVVFCLVFTGTVFSQKRRTAKPQPVTPASPVKVVNNPETAYLSGEVKVQVHGNDDVTIIRLGLAQNGATLIEFPHDDFFYAIHPPENSEILKIEDSPTRAKDHYLLVRPGAQFLPSSGKGMPSAAGSIIVQLTSGKVVTFMIFPVRDISDSAFRCAVTYDRKVIVAQRKAAGLAVNLDGKGEELPAPKPQGSEIVSPANGHAIVPEQKTRIQEPVKVAPSAVVTAQPPPTLPAPVPVQSITPVKPLKVGKTPKRDTKSEPIAVDAKPVEVKPVPPVKIETPTREPLRSQGEAKLLGILPKDDPLSPATTWVSSKHGLSAMAELAYLDADNRMIKLWIRNVTSVPVKVVPGQPELWVYTKDGKGRVLQVEPVKVISSQTSAQSSVIRANGQESYQLTFRAPILGTAQKLYVSIAQANAADEPLMVEVTVPGVR